MVELTSTLVRNVYLLYILKVVKIKQIVNILGKVTKTHFSSARPRDHERSEMQDQQAKKTEEK